MLAALKIGILGSIAYAFLGTIVGDVATEIIAVGAALTAIGWIWRRILFPAARTFQQLHRALPVLDEFGAFMQKAESLERKADNLGDRLDLIERHIGLFASEDAVNIRKAVWAEMQGPVRENPPTQ